MMMRRFREALVAIPPVCLFVVSASASEIQCGTSNVRVTASDPEIAMTVCEATERAVPQLAACSLPIQRAVIVHVLDDFASEHSNCAAWFDCSAMSIDVASPAELERIVEEDSPWVHLDPVDYFKSIVAHELAHAAFQQVAGGRAIDPADHEYVAYAMQLQFLKETDRRLILSSEPFEGRVSTLELNAFLAYMSPVRFAVKVWRHFGEAGNGCAFVGMLVRGERTLGLGDL